MKRLAGVTDGIVTATAFAAALFLAFRTPVPGRFDPVQSGGWAAAGYLLAAVAIVLGLRFASRLPAGLPRWTLRLSLYGVVVLAVLMAQARIAMSMRDARTTDHWPPRLDEIRAMRLGALPSPERAMWGARIAAHLLADSAAAGPPLAVPADWPFPGDAEIATRRTSDGTQQIWSKVNGEISACISIPAPKTTKGDSSFQSSHCGEDRLPPDLRFALPRRVAAVSARAPHPDVGRAWPQYRADAPRSGIAPEPDGDLTGWRASVDGEMRGSASVVADFVLVGAHGTGSLSALDLATGRRRWEARVPNWIHQDPVSDGRIVVVGFGDNLGSFGGRTPSGVAAFELATGHRLWTVFDEGSVMTSPVIRNSMVVYGTGVGFLRKRDLETGRLLGERRLPGYVTMAPPASSGDTIVFSLDHDHVCALLISTLDTLWCRALPNFRMMGHAAPTISDGHVIVSGAGTVFAPTLQEFSRLPRGLKRRLIRSVFFPTHYEGEAYSGQLFASLDLRDGHTRWTSRLFANPRIVSGHIAGTAVVDGSTGVIMLPVSDTLVAFDPSTGAVRWTAGGRGARGPALVADHRVIAAGRDGIIEARAISDGSLECTLRRKAGYDRAGPTLAGNLLIFANLKGEVEAIPKASLLSTC